MEALVPCVPNTMPLSARQRKTRGARVRRSGAARTGPPAAGSVAKGKQSHSIASSERPPDAVGAPVADKAPSHANRSGHSRP